MEEWDMSKEDLSIRVQVKIQNLYAEFYICVQFSDIRNPERKRSKIYYTLKS